MRKAILFLTLGVAWACKNVNVSSESNDYGDDGPETGSGATAATTSAGTGNSTPGESEAPVAGAASIPDAPYEPGEPITSVQAGVLLFEDAACERVNDDELHCSFKLTPKQDLSGELPIHPNVYGCHTGDVFAYDDRGNRYAPAEASLGTMTGLRGCVGLNLIGGVPVEVGYTFRKFSPNANEVVLFPLVPFGTGTQALKLRRLALTAGAPPEPVADGAESLGKPAGSQKALNVNFDYYACQADGTGGIDCPLVVTALGVDRTINLPAKGGYPCPGDVLAFDETNAQYIPSRIDVANETSYGCHARLYPVGIPTFVNYHFDGVPDSVQSITQLRLPIVVDDKGQELKLPALPLQR
jgi:hypothetical protein